MKASRPQSALRCSECGFSPPKWVGRCPECHAWGSVSEAGVTRGNATPGPVSAPARPITEIDAVDAASSATGIAELDRVLGGGLVPGGVVLLAGEPGVGKSTLLLDVAAHVAAQDGASVLLVSGEESAGQVRMRAGRVHALHPDLYLAAETELSAVLSHIDEVKPRLLIVDSIQTITNSEVDAAVGGITHIRTVAAELAAIAKERDIATILVGHVTKDGAIAGPRVLEHLVDVVLHFEGDKHTALRLLRTVKNRFGPADEVGCFQLSDRGIEGVADPSGLFLTKRLNAVAGSCVTVTLEGRRPLLTEVQALVTPSPLSSPRRTVSGLDSARFALVLAVLERRARLPMAVRDVFAATVGGARVTEPAIDLAVALAVASAARDHALPTDVVAIGEVGLSGDVRAVRGLQQRLAEAARHGFTRALVPSGCEVDAPGIEVIEIYDMWQGILPLMQQAPASATPH
ncbi:MAG: DNA repair protein RadA [Mycobacteriales bacterium]